MDMNPAIDRAREIYRAKDDEHWQELLKIINDYEIPLSELLINFPAFVRRRELTRILSDYDLFKMIINLPGSIVELGTYLGAGLFTWAKLLETFAPGDRSRKVYGFESGKGYDNISPEDGKPQKWIKSVVGEKKISDEYLRRMVDLTNNDNLIPGAERCILMTGDIVTTVPDFAKNNQGTRISLLFLDVNLFEPTIAGLIHLYPLVVSGGVIVLNGYGAPPWRGEAEAFEKYFRDNEGSIPKLQKFPFSIRPGAFFIKE